MSAYQTGSRGFLFVSKVERVYIFRCSLRHLLYHGTVDEKYGHAGICDRTAKTAHFGSRAKVSRSKLPSRLSVLTRALSFSLSGARVLRPPKRPSNTETQDTLCLHPLKMVHARFRLERRNTSLVARPDRS